MTFTQNNLIKNALSRKSHGWLAYKCIYWGQKVWGVEAYCFIINLSTCSPLLSRSSHSTLIRAGRRSGWNNVSTITNFIIYPNFVWNFRLLLVLPGWKTKSGQLGGYPRCLVSSPYLGTVAHCLELFHIVWNCSRGEQTTSTPSQLSYHLT